MENVKEKVITKAVGNRPLTAQERYEFKKLWEKYSDVDKFRIASKMLNIKEDALHMSSVEFIKTCAVVADLDERYGTSTIQK